MSFYIPTTYDQSVNLQSTLASATADNALNGPMTSDHHPITCRTELALFEDGSMSCEHGTATPDNPRTQACLDASIAIMLFQEAAKKFNL